MADDAWAMSEAAEEIAAEMDEDYSFSIEATAFIGDEEDRVDPTTMSDAELREAALALSPIEDPSPATLQTRVWDKELSEGISHSSIKEAVARLAPSYGLTTEAMLPLARDWLVARIVGYDFADWGDFHASRSGFEQGVAQHVAGASHATFALEVAAAALDKAGECHDPIWSKITSSAPDPTRASLALARGSFCGKLFAAGLSSPDLAFASLLALLEARELDRADVLPASAWLLESDLSRHVDSDQRQQLRLRLERELIGSLLDAGMEDEAVGRFDALGLDGRVFVLAERQPGFHAKIDGDIYHFAPQVGSDRTALAAALAKSGRADEASALIHADPDLAEKRRLFDCRYKLQGMTDDLGQDRQPAFDCAAALEWENRDRISDVVDALFVLHAIGEIDADPYPLVETGFATREMTGGTSVTLLRMRCSVLTDPQYLPLCRDWMAHAADNLAPPEDRGFGGNEAKAKRDMVAAAGLSGWQALQSRYDERRSDILRSFAGVDVNERRAWSEKAAIEPEPDPFARHELPVEYRSDRADDENAPEWPDRWANLPAGYRLVRFESEDQRAVAISLSGRLDPAGEIISGGYWVHVSDDGGKNWKAPLYTGLAEHFPYVVPPRSKMPLIDGNKLRIEVAIELLDTRSISYPPTGLRTLQKQGDLYLEIPLSQLRADTDRDGMTDIVENHLLLNRAAPVAPFVLGSDLYTCAEQGDPKSRLRAALLARLIGGNREAAIIEPIDRTADGSTLGAWKKLPSADDWPMFFKGTAEDFSCVDLPVAAFAYGDKGEAALQRHTPDFRLLEAPPLIMNRAGDRGYMEWSFGWTGGTTLAIREASGWRAVEISSWIT